MSHEYKALEDQEMSIQTSNKPWKSSNLGKKQQVYCRPHHVQVKEMLGLISGDEMEREYIKKSKGNIKCYYY